MSTHDSPQKSPVQVHWESKSPVNERLKDIVESLTEFAATEIQAVLDKSTSENQEDILSTTGNVYTLPYGRIGMLPPALFGNITKDRIELTEPLVAPDNEEERQALADKYEKWAETEVVQNPNFRFYSTPNRDLILSILSKLEGQTYPEDNWRVAAEATQRTLRDEKVYMMDAHRANRYYNASYDYDELNDAQRAIHKPYSSYVLVMSSEYAGDGSFQGTRDFTQLPVGEYGAKAASKLARATTSLNELIKMSPTIGEHVRADMDPEKEGLLVDYTARSRERHRDKVPEFAIHGIKNTLTEGVLSIAQVISLLTAEKVEGYDDYDTLVSDILESDVIEQYTRLVKPGYIGPTTLSGIYMPGSLVKKNGKLGLSRETMDVLTTMRKEFRDEAIAKWALYESNKSKGQHPGAFGLVCPAAAPKGAITEAKGFFKPFYTVE